MGGQSSRPSILKKKYHFKAQKYRDLATLDLNAMDERTRFNK